MQMVKTRCTGILPSIFFLEARSAQSAGPSDGGVGGPWMHAPSINAFKSRLFKPILIPTVLYPYGTVYPIM